MMNMQTCVFEYFEIIENFPHRKINYFIKTWYETKFESVDKEVY
jgi:hypothetical protein